MATSSATSEGAEGEERAREMEPQPPAWAASSAINGIVACLITPVSVAAQQLAPLNGGEAA